MANIDIQKKQSSGKGWLWGLLAAAGVIALVLFFIFNGEPGDEELGAEVELGAAATEGPWEPLEEEGDDDRAAASNDERANTGTNDESSNDSNTRGEAFPIAAVMDSPGEWEGRTVEGEVVVRSVPTDRGFWVEEDGQRAFFVVDPEGRESDAHIQQGQRLRISGAKVHRGLDDLTGQLVAEARQMVEDEPVFFVVDPEDFEIL